MNYYETLGLEISATDRQISSAYKQLSLKYHPDRNVDSLDAPQKLAAVEAAYKILNDKAQREIYDRENGFNQPTSRGQLSESTSNPTAGITAITATAIVVGDYTQSNNPENVPSSSESSEDASASQTSSSSSSTSTSSSSGGGISGLFSGLLQRGRDVGTSIVEKGRDVGSSIVEKTSAVGSSVASAGASIVEKGRGIVSTATAPTPPPVPKKASDEVLLETARVVCEGGWMDGGGAPIDNRVEDLAFGWGSEKTLDSRGNRMFFYRLTVDTSCANNGFSLVCASYSMLLYKITVFNKTGDKALFSKLSKKSLDGTSSFVTLHFTKFPVYDFNSPYNADIRNNESSVTNALDHLSKVESFESSNLEIESGHYLVCVSFEEASGVAQKALEMFGNVPYKLSAVQSKVESPGVSEITSADTVILESKSQLGSLKSEYEAAKAQFEAVCKKIKSEADKVDAIVQSREIAYRSLIESSITAYRPNQDGAEAASSPSMFPASTSNLPLSITVMANPSSVAATGSKLIGGTMDKISDIGTGIQTSFKAASSSVMNLSRRSFRSNSQSSEAPVTDSTDAAVGISSESLASSSTSSSTQAAVISVDDSNNSTEK